MQQKLLQIYLTYFLSLAFCFCYAQNKKTDSLIHSLSSEKIDSNKVKTLLLIAFNYYKAGDYKLAQDYVTQGTNLAEKGDNKKLFARALNNLANVYKAQNNYAPALQAHLKALKIRTEINDKIGVAFSLMNIGIVYSEQSDYDKALDYYAKSLQIRTEIGDRQAIGALYNNFGTAYAAKKETQKAIDYYTLGLREKEKDKDTSGMALSIGLIANGYDDQHEYTKALEWYNKSLQLYTKMGEVYGCALTLNNIGRNYLKQKKYAQAEKTFTDALTIATKNNYLEIIKQLNFNLSKLFTEKGDMQKALTCYKNYILFRDSIYNEENTKKLVRTEMNFEFEKKEAAVKIEQEKKEAVALAESRKQKIIIWSVCGILILVLVFAIFVYRSYLQKQKTNIEISKQKHIIEEKQKEILDSIHYAKRIQQALLPNEKYIDKNLNKSKA